MKLYLIFISIKCKVKQKLYLNLHKYNKIVIKSSFGKGKVGTILEMQTTIT